MKRAPQNVWRLFRGDVRRMGRNVVTVIIVCGLVAIPSIFSWYNIIACWNVFDNTGNLTVAVANSDEGYESDLVPVRVNIGEQVVSALRANDQMNWEFVSEDEAIEGAKSGRYYAAVVIPREFSRDMMTFYTADSERAPIRYYANEKKNAIAPKVTDQGADQISAQVNRVFAETLSEVALGLASSLLDYMDDADANGALGTLGQRASSVGERMVQGASVIDAYASLLDTARSFVDDSGALISQAQSSVHDVAAQAGKAEGTSDSVASAMRAAADGLSSAIDQGAQSCEALGAAVDEAFDSSDTLAADSASQLRDKAQSVREQAAHLRELASQLEDLGASIPEQGQAAADALAARLNASAALQEQMAASLESAASSIETGASYAQAKRDEVKSLGQQAAESLAGVKADYDANLAPTLRDLSDAVGQAASSLEAAGAKLDSAADDLAGATGSVSAHLSEVQEKLADAASGMRESGEKLSGLGDDISAALASGDSQALREVIGSDPAVLAESLSAPVSLERHAVFSVDNFGSAMAPLYTTLALWIGALLIMVTLKTTPSQRTLAELDHPSARQLFIGRFGIVGLVSFLQSTCVAVGNMLFLRVQVENPALYLLCFWISGLVFAFIIYTLVVSFANFGKALSVFLLVIQVSGGGGSYPLQLLPDFVGALSPYLPITHAVSAMRAAMFGVYQGDFWMEMGTLLLFAVPFLLLGLVLRNPLIKVVSGFVEKVESTKVM